MTLQETAYRTGVSNKVFRCGIYSNMFMDPLAITRGFEDRPLGSHEGRNVIVCDAWGASTKHARKISVLSSGLRCLILSKFPMGPTASKVREHLQSR